MDAELEPVMLGHHHGPCQRCGWRTVLEDTKRALCALCLDSEPIWQLLDRKRGHR